MSSGICIGCRRDMDERHTLHDYTTTGGLKELQSGHFENGQDDREDQNKMERQPYLPPGSCVANNS